MDYSMPSITQIKKSIYVMLHQELHSKLKSLSSELYLHTQGGGHGVTVVTHSPPTFEVHTSNPEQEKSW